MSEYVKIENLYPEDLDEAIDLLKVFYGEHLSNISTMTESEFRASAHFGAGMFLRNTWYLWWFQNHTYTAWPKEKPKLVQWFNDLDIVHADDMSDILLTCFYRSLVGTEYGIDDKIAEIKQHWREQGYSDGIPRQK